MRIRKNAAFLEEKEWTRYCKAIVILKHTFPAGSRVSIYDQFVAMHLCVWGLKFGWGPAGGTDGAHKGPAFLPWHREYLRRYEAALSAVDPTVTLPYWNWGSGKEGDIFKDDHMGPRNGKVEKGYFTEKITDQNEGLPWTIHPDLRPFDSGLTRGDGKELQLPSADDINKALEQQEYSTFHQALEGTKPANKYGEMHNRVHVWVGGDMTKMTSPNDPIFFMHHAQVDRIWAMWQIKHPGVENYYDGTNYRKNFIGKGHGPDDNMWPWDEGLSRPGPLREGKLDPAVAATLIPSEAPIDLVKPRDVLDIEALGYKYD